MIGRNIAPSKARRLRRLMRFVLVIWFVRFRFQHGIRHQLFQLPFFPFTLFAGSFSQFLLGSLRFHFHEVTLRRGRFGFARRLYDVIDVDKTSDVTEINVVDAHLRRLALGILLGWLGDIIEIKRRVVVLRASFAATVG